MGGFTSFSSDGVDGVYRKKTEWNLKVEGNRKEEREKETGNRLCFLLRTCV